MPSEIPVDFYMLLIWKRRRFRRIKNFLLRRLLTICEVLAN